MGRLPGACKQLLGSVGRRRAAGGFRLRLLGGTFHGHLSIITRLRKRRHPPADPGNTTAFPENRTWFTHESLVAVNSDEECRECLWLPVCAGGCPKRRLAGQRECVFWKDDPEGFVLAQYANMGEKGRSTKAGPEAVGRVIAPVLRKFGVARAWVYGSFALGRANVHSDVDLIVEMPSGVNLGRSFFDLRRELKAALGRRVDLHLPPNAGARADYVRVLERTRVLVFDEGK